MSELVLTILSQNTSDANSGRAFMRLRSRFRTWEELLAAGLEAIVPEIQAGGVGGAKDPPGKGAPGGGAEKAGRIEHRVVPHPPPPEGEGPAASAERGGAEA